MLDPASHLGGYPIYKPNHHLGNEILTRGAALWGKAYLQKERDLPLSEEQGHLGLEYLLCQPIIKVQSE